MMRQRAKIIPEAEGVVLEVGIGSGLNIPFYNKSKVKQLIGVDPTPHRRKLKEAIELSGLSCEMVYESAEHLDIDDQSIDTIVTTYTFCSIGDLDSAISECRRVLKPRGSLIFIEHGLSPDIKVRRIQNRINPIWKPLAGGCHLNRDIPLILTKNGWNISSLDEMYLPGWKNFIVDSRISQDKWYGIKVKDQIVIKSW